MDSTERLAEQAYEWLTSPMYGKCPVPKNENTVTIRAFGDSAISDVFDSGVNGEAFSRFPFPVKVNEHGHRHEVVVDKRTHRIRFENETEHEVTIVIEPK